MFSVNFEEYNITLSLRSDHFCIFQDEEMTTFANNIYNKKYSGTKL